MTPLKRMSAASFLFDSARKIVESSLPRSLTTQQRRLAITRRIYGEELPEAAMIAHARHVSPAQPVDLQDSAARSSPTTSIAPTTSL